MHLLFVNVFIHVQPDSDICFYTPNIRLPSLLGRNSVKLCKNLYFLIFNIEVDLMQQYMALRRIISFLLPNFEILLRSESKEQRKLKRVVVKAAANRLPFIPPVLIPFDVLRYAIIAFSRTTCPYTQVKRATKWSGAKIDNY